MCEIRLPVGAEHKDGRVDQVGGEELQVCERRLVRPLQVVENQQEWTCACLLPQQCGEHAVELSAGGVGVELSRSATSAAAAEHIELDPDPQRTTVGVRRWTMPSQPSGVERSELEAVLADAVAALPDESQASPTPTPIGVAAHRIRRWPTA